MKPVLLRAFYLSLYSSVASAQPVIGWLETAAVFSNTGLQIPILAKIDTGADHSSLHATDIELFRKENQQWVRFKTQFNLEWVKPVYRMAKIKTKQGGVQSRAVIWLDVCLDQKKQTIEINLVNRSHLSRPLLVGRSALAGWLVDPQKTNLASKQRCKP